MSGDYRARAACGPDTAELFDPLEDRDRKDGGVARMRAAKAICGGCPVRVECLAAGIEDGEHGVRGGEYLEAGRVQTSLPGFGRPRAACGTDSARTRHRRNRERCSVCWPPNETKKAGRPRPYTKRRRNEQCTAPAPLNVERPVESYFGPAAPQVIKDLVDALCPPHRAPQEAIAVDLHRPIDTYFGPAAPEVIQELVDALFPLDAQARARRSA